jgi:CreA protein
MRPHFKLSACCGLAFILSACGSSTDEVGEFKNDWAGNEIKIEALRDPDVAGVVCHLAHFDRGFWDRIGKGNWFENPSNSSISCHRTGPIDLDTIRTSKSGEEVFTQKQSLIFKNLAVRRILDTQNQTLIYVSYSRKPIDGSAKMSLSTIPLMQGELSANADN